MIELTGYIIDELIYKGVYSILYKGIRTSDNTKVIIKILNNEYPTLEEIEKIKREYRIMNKPYGDRVIKGYGIENYKKSICIILEDYGAKSLLEFLKTKELDLKKKLSIASDIARAVCDIHKQGVIHKDINPSNIVINFDTYELKIIDFGISTVLNNEKLQYMNKLEGTYPYMPPEQTGRINRIIDQRSDLYSIGVTLYEIFTGKLPFMGNELEVIHSHIAKKPVPPNVVNKTIPKIVSDIIMKLLSKNSESRYQTIAGLRHDLEYCLEGFVKDGWINNFEIAKNDVSDKFQIPQKLYGRDKEIGILKNAFNSIEKNPIKLLLVSGYSGIGKTSIIREMSQEIVNKGGRFISGKFEQLDKRNPYSALVSAFEKLIENIIFDTKNLEIFKKCLKEVLGANAKIITTIVPQLEKIIGEQPEVRKLSPSEDRNRFYMAFRDFINVFVSEEHPLVIFLDDLQWSDVSTIDLLKSLLLSSKINGLIIIGAYRDNEVKEGHPLFLMLDEVKNIICNSEFLNELYIKPINEEILNQLIADTLKYNYKETKTLSNYIFQKTKGNPFFTNQLLKSLYENGIFRFNQDTSKWEWDIKEIEKTEISDNVIDFLIQNLSLLPSGTLNILKLSSCIGNYFDLKTLYLINDSIDNISNALWGAIEKEFIIPLDSNYRLLDIKKGNFLKSNIEAKFRFVHDRVQQAAYSLIPENEKELIHQRIGKTLLSYYKDGQMSDSVLFDITNHLNIAKNIIKDKEERIELLELNYKSGKKAKGETAYDIARKYFSTGKSLLLNEEWSEYPDELFDLSFEYAEVSYLSGNVEGIIELCDDMFKMTRDNIEKAKVYELKGRVLDPIGEKRELIIDEIRKGLRLFDINLPSDPEEIIRQVDEGIGRMQEYFSKNNVEDLVKLPKMRDKNKIIIMQLFNQIIPPALEFFPPLCSLIQIRMFEIALLYGTTELSCKNFVDIGITQANLLGNYETAYKLGQAAFFLLDKYKADFMRSATYFVFASFISQWRKHYKESFEYFDLSVKYGMETGDINHAAWAYIFKFVSSVQIGKNLKEIKLEIENIEMFMKRFNSPYVLLHLRLSKYPINQLQQPYNTELENYEMKKIKESQNIGAIYILGLYNVMVNFILGKNENTEKWIALTDKNIKGIPGLNDLPDYFMFKALYLMDKYNDVSAAEQEEFSVTINEILSKLKNWHINCTENFSHKYYIVEAEFARIQNKSLGIVVDLYKKSLDSLNSGEFLHIRAVINEIISKFWFSKNNEIIGKAYIKEAYYYYNQWGADAKINLLNEKYPHIFKSISNKNITTYRPTTMNSSVEGLDLMSIIKASKAISSEIKLDKLLKVLMDTVIENAGAQNGCIFLRSIFDDNFYIEAIKNKVDNKIKIMNSIFISDSLDFCNEIIQSVIGTKEPVIIGNALQDKDYKNNKYIKNTNVVSILCAPIIYQNDLKGIIYLENNLTDNVFSIEKLEVIKVLSSQIAISIEKAQLSQALVKIKETQKNLVQAEKMASLGNLVVGVAHEINTPVGVSLTAATHMIGTTEEIIKNYNNDNISKTELEEYLNDSIESIELVCMNLNKAASLIKGFKRVSADMSNEDKRIFNVKKYIEEILISLSPKLKKYKHNIEVFCDENLEILSYPGVYSQILTNMIINSIVHAYNEDDEGKIKIRVIKNGNSVELIYSDDGRGMNAETKSKIFEPFFTTNRLSGTGLGMHIIFNIVTQTLKGNITCESTLNKGTTFIIKFEV